MKTLCFGFIAASMVYGQTGSLAKPQIGFVFDNASHSLRRLQGLPGAAMVGSSMEFGFVPANAYVAPRGDAAFVAGQDGSPHFLRLTSDGTADTSIEKLASFQNVVYSPSGAAAALISVGNIQIIKGLPNSAAIVGTLSPRVQAGRRRPLPQVLAVSDDGAYMIYATDGALELAATAGDSRRIADSVPGMLAAFAPGTHDAALATSDSLTLFTDLTGPATSRKFTPVAAASSLAFAPDGRSLLIASATSHNVTALQLETGEATALPCDCEPTSLARTGNLFRLNELGKGPLWLLDPATRNLFFVPAP